MKLPCIMCGMVVDFLDIRHLSTAQDLTPLDEAMFAVIPGRGDEKWPTNDNRVLGVAFCMGCLISKGLQGAVATINFDRPLTDTLDIWDPIEYDQAESDNKPS